MLDVGKKIKELRNSKNISQEELANKIDVNKATIANYEANRRALTIDKLEIILKALGTSLNGFLITEITKNDNTDISTDIKKIPIISKASAGLGVEGIDEVIDWVEISNSISHNADFATFIDGDSMEPKIHDDDLVLVVETNMLDSGEIGIFSLNGDIYCKKFQHNEFTKETLLKSLNPIYKSIRIDEEDEFRIIGKVVGVFDYTI